MANPARDLELRVIAALDRAFGADAAGADPAVHSSAHADYQADVAMALAKRLRRPPRQVADAVLAALERGEVIEHAALAGPGFLNLSLRSDYVAAQLRKMLSDERLDVPIAGRKDRVIIDYSSTNAAKEMLVGHMRSTVIGDALVRILELLGHEVLPQNHVGDWGTPFGMLIEHMLDSRAGGRGDLTVGDLNAFYRDARAKFDADPAFAERARRRVVALQAGDTESRELWSGFIAVSFAHMDEVYGRLGVRLRREHIAPESSYNPELAGVVDELLAQRLLVESEGALCAFPEGFVGREDAPQALIVRKQDGGYGYAATDLAALRHRTRNLRGTRLVYVVGAPQALHLAMVFAVARKAGWAGSDVKLEHVAFGSVLGPDGKMLKTRAGESVRLSDLLDEAVARAARIVDEKAPELDAATRGHIAHAVGIGAVKYADLSVDRVKDYVFSWDRMLSFDGNTGPYLMYAHARARSILRRADEDPHPPGLIVPPEAGPERALALQLLELAPILERTAETLEPHRLCGYLYRVATAFTAFFEACPVLKAEPATRASRLELCRLTAAVLARGLDVLGIKAPERM